MNVSKILESGDHTFIESVRDMSEYEKDCLAAIKHFGGVRRLKEYLPDIKKVKKRAKSGKALHRIPLLWWMANATFESPNADGSLGPATVDVDSELGTFYMNVCTESEALNLLETAAKGVATASNLPAIRKAFVEYGWSWTDEDSTRFATDDSFVGFTAAKENVVAVVSGCKNKKDIVVHVAILLSTGHSKPPLIKELVESRNVINAILAEIGELLKTTQDAEENATPVWRGQIRKSGERVCMDGSSLHAQWVYGNLYAGEGDFDIIYGAKTFAGSRHQSSQYLVYSDTVQRSTPWDDADGKRIFEGDIILWAGVEYVIVWNDSDKIFEMALHKKNAFFSKFNCATAATSRVTGNILEQEAA